MPGKRILITQELVGNNLLTYPCDYISVLDFQDYLWDLWAKVMHLLVLVENFRIVSANGGFGIQTALQKDKLWFVRGAGEWIKAGSLS